MIVSRAPGKLLLLGEYAVLEGAPALVMAVDRRAEVRIEDHREGIWVCSSLPSLENPLRLAFGKNGRGGPRQLAPVMWALRTAMHSDRHARTDARGMKISIDTRQFSAGASGAKLGLGSSAALTVALLAALRHVHSCDADLPLTRESLFREAFASHRKAQRGFGSGADVAASVYGGMLRYERGAGRIPRPVVTRMPGFPAGMSSAVVWTGRPASTARLLARLRAFKQQRARSYRHAIAGLAQTSIEGCNAFMQGDAPRFMESVERACSGLEVLGKKSGIDVVSREHREAKRIVHAQEGVYKPSGAGVGDLGIAFFRETEARERALAGLRGRGYRILDLGIDRFGIVTGEKQKDED